MSVSTLAFSLLTVLGLAACSGSSSGPATIGVLFPFSGGSAFIGQIANSGVYPCVRAVNNSGGVDGHRIAVDDIDTKNDPADALPLAQRFTATTSNVFYIQGPGTTEGPILAPFFNSSKVVMQSAAGESQFDRNRMQYFWRAYPPDPENGIAMAMTAKKLGITRIAAVFGSDQGSQGDLPGVLYGAKKVGLKIVSQQNLSPDQPSYQSQVARVLAAKPQAIFTETDPTSGATFYGEMVHQPGGASTRIFGDNTTVMPSWMGPVQGAVGKSLFQKLYLGVAAQSANPNPATALFNTELKASGAHVPNPGQYLGNPYSMIGFDACTTTALAATAARSIKSTDFNSYIPQVTSPGPGKTVVYSYADGVKALKAGKKIQYIGAAGPIDFNQYHNSSAGDVAETLTPSGGLKQVYAIPFSKIAQLG